MSIIWGVGQQISSWSKDNYAIESGLAHSQFLFSIIAALSKDRDLLLLVATGADSLLVPSETMTDINHIIATTIAYPDRYKHIEIPGYGHEVGSNATIYTLLARAAIEAQLII